MSKESLRATDRVRAELDRELDSIVEDADRLGEGFGFEINQLEQATGLVNQYTGLVQRINKVVQIVAGQSAQTMGADWNSVLQKAVRAQKVLGVTAEAVNVTISAAKTAEIGRLLRR